MGWKRKGKIFMRTTGHWKWLALVGISMLLALTALPAAPAAAQVEAAAVPGRFYGTAYVTYATANTGSLATTLGRTARITTGCYTGGNKFEENRVHTVDAGELARVDTLYTSVRTTRTDDRATVQTTARAEGVNLLDDLITADAIVAVSTTTATATQITTSDNGSRFVNLRIGGNSISAVARNTTINLKGLGYVRLHSVNQESEGDSKKTLAVAMVQIVITQANKFDLPIGARIVISRAWSGYNRVAIEAILGGEASATSAEIEIDEIENLFGKSALIWVTCEGTDGKVLRNSVNETEAGDLLYTGTGVTTAFGGPNAAGTGHYARTTATVEKISLLEGPLSTLITVDAVRAVSRSEVVGGVVTHSTGGSSIGKLKVLGNEININVKPNTKLELDVLVGIDVTLYKVTRTTTEQKVTMIHIVVTDEVNVLDLPVGAEIHIANASSKARGVN